MATPLDGIFVLDFTRLLPGPLAARLLADLGARVVKVEEPVDGDPVRLAPPFEDGVGALARLLLSGVESVALDLRRPEARRVALGLAERADVVLESFRPGTLARLGLDPEELRRRHPELVVASVSGWGESGPWAGRTGHDLAYQAVAGTLASSGMPNLPAADLLGAWAAVASVLAALVRRERGGGGARVDAALLDAAVHGNLTGWAAEAAGPRGDGEALPLTGALPCYAIYRTRDGRRVALAALERRFWDRLCRAAGRPELVRLQHRADARSRRKVAELAASRDFADWRRLFEEHDLPCAGVLTPAEARAHPQVAARGLVEDGGGMAPGRLGFPAFLDGERPRAEGGVPAVGEHTLDVLAELGLEEASLSPRELRRRGIGPRKTLASIVRRRLATRRL